MGRIGSSSSRRKHSNKKSLKVSSKGYRKKKSRRNKSKKLRHRDDSFSSSSDDESTSSSLNSSSSSEGEFKTKRARSRSRSEIKGSKKRKRRRDTSEDSIDGSLVVKKRKRSKKSKRVKKKKKGSKRDGYSSDSGSCSTCKDEDSSSDEPGSHERSRGRSREKGHRGSTKGRIGKREKRSKSRRSVSPSSSYDSESVENKNMIMENTPVRLKSVITVANVENDEEENMKNDELKEEIVYDYDDYPSSKSNDSVELGDHFNSSNVGDNEEKDSNVSGNIGPEADDLESILRQKALENLSRFRGGIKTKPVVPVDDKPKLDPSDVNPLQPVTHKSRFTWRRDPSGATLKDEKAATYNDNKIVNKTSMIDTGNVDQKSTAVVGTPSIKEGSSKELQNESNDNLQFEKKTMSVMRGGEMVQVSYKVYIPNKAPALARRQLKR